MPRSAFLALLAALGLAAPAAADAKDIAGVWLSPSHSAHVEISRCGEAYCGKLLSVEPYKSNPQMLDLHNKNPAMRSRQIVGTTLISGFRGGPTRWTGGKVYNPSDGNWYRGAITVVDESHIQLKGCAFAFICKSQTWTRVE